MTGTFDGKAWLVLVGAVLLIFVLLVARGPVEDGDPVTLPRLNVQRVEITPPADVLPTAEVNSDGWDVPPAREIANLKSHDVDQTHGHGRAHHPDEAPEVWQCLDENGPYGGWVFRLGNEFLRFCDLGQHDLSDDPMDRWFGLNIIKRDSHNGRWVEVTTYILKLKDRTLGGVMDHLAGRGWTLMKGG